MPTEFVGEIWAIKGMSASIKEGRDPGRSLRLAFFSHHARGIHWKRDRVAGV
jgi:hypothetical protein